MERASRKGWHVQWETDPPEKDHPRDHVSDREDQREDDEVEWLDHHVADREPVGEDTQERPQTGAIGAPDQRQHRRRGAGEEKADRK